MHLFAFHKQIGEIGVEYRGDDKPRARLAGAKNGNRAARGVKKGRDQQAGHFFLHPDPLKRMAGIVGEAVMVEQHTFGETGAAGGILDLRDVLRCYFGPFVRQRTFGKQRVMVLHINHFADHIVLLRHTPGNFAHRIAAKAFDDEQADRAGLLRDISQFALLVTGIAGDKNQAGNPECVFAKDPFRNVGRPYDQPFAWPEPGQQRVCKLFTIRKQLRIGPCTATGAGLVDLVQCDLVWPFLRSEPEDAGDSRFS